MLAPRDKGPDAVPQALFTEEKGAHLQPPPYGFQLASPQGERGPRRRPIVTNGDAITKNRLVETTRDSRTAPCVWWLSGARAREVRGVMLRGLL